LGHPSKFQRVSRLGSVTARHSSSGRQPKFAALNRGRHLHSAGRPSRWVLAHILGCTGATRQSFVMVPRLRIFGQFLRSVFSARHVQHTSDLHSKLALRPHHVVDIQCATAEIRRGKRRKTKEEETTGRKYNIRICYAVRRAATII